MVRTPAARAGARADAPQIAIGVMVAWGRTIYRQFELLAGKSAPHDFLQLLIYNAATFSEEIEKVDTVRAYHVRPRLHPARFELNGAR